MAIYSAALDEQGVLHNIKDVVKKTHKFHCPHCGIEMIPRQGKTNEWHFTHKGKKCQWDSYLHTLAEIMISEWYNINDEILLNYVENHTSYQCQYNKCIKYNWNNRCCSYLDQDIYKCQMINLKEQFCNAKTEKTFNGYKYKADVLLENNNDAIYFEILVTHPCSEEKINSGLKIIEFKIESFEDILEIVSSNIIDCCNNPKIKNYNLGIQGTKNCSNFEETELYKEFQKLLPIVEWFNSQDSVSLISSQSIQLICPNKYRCKNQSTECDIRDYQEETIINLKTSDYQCIANHQTHSIYIKKNENHNSITNKRNYYLLNEIHRIDLLRGDLRYADTSAPLITIKDIKPVLEANTIKESPQIIFSNFKNKFIQCAKYDPKTIGEDVVINALGTGFYDFAHPTNEFSISDLTIDDNGDRVNN